MIAVESSEKRRLSPQGTSCFPLGTRFYSCPILNRLNDLVHFVGVTRIVDSSFMNSSNLLSVVIPVNVSNMAYNSFRNNQKLEYIKLLPSSVITMNGNNCLYNTNNCPVYVPDELVQSYKTASNWSQYASRFKGLSEFVP